MIAQRMSKRGIPEILLLGTFLLGASSLRSDDLPKPTLPVATEAWRADASRQLLCASNDRVWFPESDKVVRIMGVESRGPETWTVRDKGQLTIWKVSRTTASLRTEISGQATEYKKLRPIPEGCLFKIVTIGRAHPVTRERARAVSTEIHERLLRDQESAKAGNLKPTSEVIVQNREWLKKLIRDLGWIDVSRFGREGSGNAIILAQHSQDLSLMAAVMPLVERDYRGDPEDSVMFAIFYDALQQNLGRKQRYGTQTGRDSEGNPMVLPLEDISKVELFRKEIGLPPLSEYMQQASEFLYSGKPLRMPRADE